MILEDKSIPNKHNLENVSISFRELLKNPLSTINGENIYTITNTIAEINNKILNENWMTNNNVWKKFHGGCFYYVILLYLNALIEKYQNKNNKLINKLNQLKEIVVQNILKKDKLIFFNVSQFKYEETFKNLLEKNELNNLKNLITCHMF
jgi:hypothetical protein